MLPDNVLLDIFEFGVSEWHRLVHVCRRWRYIVFASPHRLDLTILCTYGIRVKKNLGCWPPFPIVVDYLRGFSPSYEEDVIAALEHTDRVRSVKLDVTGSLLAMVASMMQEAFMVLTTLWLTSNDLNAPVLPDIFLNSSAPQLQQIYLAGISFPALPTLLLSASDLVDLQLKDIPQGGYISPEAMAASLAALIRLDNLRIWFKSPTSHLQLTYSTLLTRDVLPSLITFDFRGCSEYLEHFLARIDTPRLDSFTITYFNQSNFQVPQLSRFIGRTENLELAQSRHEQVHVCVSNAYIELYFKEKGHHRSLLTLRVSCEGLDWQISHLAQILDQSPIIVSNVDKLSIDEIDMQLYPGSQDGVDDTNWLELLRPFTSVKMLHGCKHLARHIAIALDGVTEEMVTGVLPALDSLTLENQPLNSVRKFLAMRRLSGHPVTFVDPADFPSKKFPGTKGHTSDVLVDGLVARTFTPEDANNYFKLLLNTPPSQDFLQFYGIVYHQGAWYVTHNANLVQGTSPGVPVQPTPLLDYDMTATNGTVVPQRRWTPADSDNIRRSVESAVLQLPIFFVDRNGGLGLGLQDILRGRYHDLHNAYTFAPLGGLTTTLIRINWPGYRYWTRQIVTRDGTRERNPITVARFMKHIASSVDKFFTECISQRYVAADCRWRIGYGGITTDEVKIIGVIHVSAGTWMPIIQLTRYVF